MPQVKWAVSLVISDSQHMDNDQYTQVVSLQGKQTVTNTNMKVHQKANIMDHLWHYKLALIWVSEVHLPIFLNSAPREPSSFICSVNYY